jgi:hypothetical protein
MKFQILTQTFIRTSWLVRRAVGMIHRTKQWPPTSDRKCASRIAPSACQPNRELTANIIITTFTTCTVTLKLSPLKGTNLTSLNDDGTIMSNVATTVRCVKLLENVPWSCRVPPFLEVESTQGTGWVTTSLVGVTWLTRSLVRTSIKFFIELNFN